LRIRKEIGNKKGIAASYNNIGEVYRIQGNSQVDKEIQRDKYDRALENHFASLKIREEIGDKQGIAISYNNISAVYIKQNKTAEAKKQLLLSLSIAKSIGSKVDIKEAYKTLSLCDSAAATSPLIPLQIRGEYWKEAYQYHKLYKQYNDSIFNNESDKRTVEMTIKYESVKKEKAIEIQTHKLSEQELLLRTNRLFLILLAIGSLLLLALGWIAFFRYKAKKESQIKSEILKRQELRTNTIIETQEQERKRIAQDLHDGIGQTLAGIKMNFSTIKISAEEDAYGNRKLFNQTLKSLDDAYKEVRSLSHQMMPKALQESGLIDAIDDLLDKTLKGSIIKYTFEKDTTLRFHEKTEIGLYRVFQELLNNILKHASATEIQVHLHKTKEQIILMVEDNGVGIKQQQSNNKK
ncbi:MAG: histidine kinase, partial [Bacteroidota bacterium]